MLNKILNWLFTTEPSVFCKKCGAFMNMCDISDICDECMWD